MPPDRAGTADVSGKVILERLQVRGRAFNITCQKLVAEAGWGAFAQQVLDALRGRRKGLPSVPPHAAHLRATVEETWAGLGRRSEEEWGGAECRIGEE